jgi:hypothetical protein
MLLCSICARSLLHIQTRMVPSWQRPEREQVAKHRLVLS